MRILIAPGHYLFSDKYGSEPLWSAELVRGLAAKVEQIDVIVGVYDCNSQFPKNVHVYALFDKRSPSVFVELIRRSGFYLLVTVKALKLMLSNDYQAVHHMLPFSLATFNPLIPISRAVFNNKLTVIGPIQPPYTSNYNDLDLALIGHKTNPAALGVIQIVYFLLSSIIGSFSKLMLKSSERVIYVSDLARAYYSRFTNSRYSIIPPLISDTEIAGTDRSVKQNRVIICVGPLINRKGHEYLIKAMSNAKLSRLGLSLILVGDGPERTRLEELSANLGLSGKVTFVGQVTRDRVLTYYKEAAIACLPSLEDSYPTVLIEAMANGLPIVATDVGSVREMVGQAGVVVAKPDPDMLAEGLEKIMGSARVWKMCASNSRRQYVQKYSPEAILRQYLQAYSN